MKKPRILIVEDHLPTLDSLKLIFEFEGYLVDTLQHAGRVFLSLENHRPDVMLINALLEHEDGRLLCKLIKASRFSSIPIRLMSALDPTKHESYQTAWEEVVEKPFAMAEILEKVADQLTRIKTTG